MKRKLTIALLAIVSAVGFRFLLKEAGGTEEEPFTPSMQPTVSPPSDEWTGEGINDVGIGY